jgi:tellurite resistance protein
MVLLASVWLQWGQPTASAVLWCAGAGLESLISVVVFYRLFKASLKDDLKVDFWPAITPSLLIPAVGNALVVLAGIPLGFGTWSAVQFVLGCGLWPLVWGLLVLRQARVGALPRAMLPTWCILLSPPSVVGLGLLAWQQSTLATQEPSMGWGIGAWTCWVLAGVNLWQIKPHARAVLSAPFAMAHWALSFPFAAYASLTWALLASVLTMYSSGGSASGSPMLSVLAGCLGWWAGTLWVLVLVILSVLSVKTLKLVLRPIAALSESQAAHPRH